MSASLPPGWKEARVQEGFLPGGASDDGYRPSAANDWPFFFLSYAHSPQDEQSGSDPDVWIGELYSDLCGHVRQLADLPKGAQPGFMDRELRQGHEWPDRLAKALATCRVFVPLYSKRYFKSEQCGKEWFAFNMRRLNQKAKSARAVETIIPALWIPLPDGMLPEAASSVQYSAADFNKLYTEHGFYGIMKVKRWRDIYEEVAFLLAKQIVAAAEASPSLPSALVPYESLPSAFGGKGATGLGDKPLGITVVAPIKGELPEGRDEAYYGSDFRAWNPYRGDSMRPLAAHATDVAKGLSYTPEVGDLFRNEARLVGREPPSRPEVLLVDPWAAMLPECGEVLQQLDSQDNPWVQVVVVWNQKDAQMRTERRRLVAALGDALPRKLREGRATHVFAVRGVPSLEEFGLVLPPVIAEAGRHYLRFLSARLPQEPQVPQKPEEAGE
jgi:FxsC-like protein